MFSPAQETYGPNKIPPVLLGLSAILVAVGLSDVPNAALILGVGAALLIVWLLSVKVSLHPEGIQYRSLFGEKALRWDELEKFYYSATKRSVNFIPVGTYYNYKLVAGDGATIQFGNRVERPGELGGKLLDLTYGPLLKKAAGLFASGADVLFGDITVNRGSGITFKRLFRRKTIPWGELQEYRIEKGQFFLWRLGQRYGSGLPLHRVPNAFVLLDLLDAVVGAEQ